MVRREAPKKSTAKIKEPRFSEVGNVEHIILFFINVFCVEIQGLLHDKKNSGPSRADADIVREFIIYTRHRAAILGDVWWFNTIRFETTIQQRIGKLLILFERWDAVRGRGAQYERKRVQIANKITKQVGKLGRTYRINSHILKNDMDLKQMEGDIEYFVALRGLGLPALKNAVSSSIGEIFRNIRDKK